MTEITDNGTFHVKYDAWNRMTEITDNGTAGIAKYGFDGLRRRILETIENGENDIVRVSYYNEAWQIMEQRQDGVADPLKQFIWDQRYVDSPIVRFHDGNTDGTLDDTVYYLTDANMNVTALVDATSGEVVERYAYDPYGKVTFYDGSWNLVENGDVDGIASAVDNRVLYAGYHHDAETGIYQVRNRMYHPTLGRFIHRDPLKYVDGMNLYEYVRSEPVGYVDPKGGRVVNPAGREAVVDGSVIIINDPTISWADRRIQKQRAKDWQVWQQGKLEREAMLQKYPTNPKPTSKWRNNIGSLKYKVVSGFRVIEFNRPDNTLDRKSFAWSNKTYNTWPLDRPPFEALGISANLSAKNFIGYNRNLVHMASGAGDIAARIVASVSGNIKKYQKPSEFLMRFLSGVGGRKILSAQYVKQLFADDLNSKLLISNEVRKIRQYINSHLGEVIGKDKHLVSTNVDEVSTQNPEYTFSIHNYRVWISVSKIQCRGTQLSMEVTAHIEDVYDWDITSTHAAGIGLYDRNLAMLHRYGGAREFEIRGEYTFRDSWRIGKDSN